jgi:hypothetical protein
MMTRSTNLKLDCFLRGHEFPFYSVLVSSTSQHLPDQPFSKPLCVQGAILALHPPPSSAIAEPRSAAPPDDGSALTVPMPRTAWLRSTMLMQQRFPPAPKASSSPSSSSLEALYPFAPSSSAFSSSAAARGADAGQRDPGCVRLRGGQGPPRPPSAACYVPAAWYRCRCISPPPTISAEYLRLSPTISDYLRLPGSRLPSPPVRLSLCPSVSPIPQPTHPAAATSVLRTHLSIEPRG